MNKYLSFSVKNQSYLFDIKDVNSIVEKEFHEIRKIPDTPEYFVGVTQLREKTIGIIDCNYLFNNTKTETDKKIKVIIVYSESEELYGIIVHDVNGVIEIPEDSSIKQDAISKELNQYVVGIYQKGEEIQLIIDVNLLINFKKINVSYVKKQEGELS